MKNKHFSILLLCLVFGCNSTDSQKNTSQKPQNTLKTGLWRATISLKGGEAPFQFDLKKTGGNYEVILINGKERLKLDEVSVQNDSISITLNIFDAELKAKILDNEHLEGHWIKYGYKEPYEVPFKAAFGKNYRFEESKRKAETDFTGKWEMTFTDKDQKSYPAVGIFEQKGKKITGTILTPTGDYRYLEGLVEGREIRFSAFDGSHGFLFIGNLNEQEDFKGEFWPGKLGYETWTGKRNEKAALPDANTLTYLKDGYQKLEFSFPNLEGKPISLADEKYQNKVVIVQLFGSWCPNCMDETAFLAPYFEKNRNRGLEIIGLAYERSPDFEKAKLRIEKMIQKYKIGYDFLIAGINDKTEASKTLPMLNQVLAFPTTIFIDRKGEVRRIHTGFSGPGTGVYYEKFVIDFQQFMDELLEEKI